MNYFIFKGINSKEFSGLVVNTLPPITKAPKRVGTQEIDGVDGEIVTELGYSAYDKDITITLLKHNDIDEIIEWLNGEGELVTSLEPDKFYKARIINRIDYERLYNFKTATITFRVQPYKYELDENPTTLTESGKSVTNNGLEVSKPKFTITGTGTIELSINNLLVFRYTFPDGENEVVIDSEKQDAYLGSILKNRNMTGEFPILKSGSNIVSWSGNITSIVIEPKSRWI